MKQLVRGAALSVALLAAGTWGLALATNGFHAFTAQAARTLEVRAQPRAVPAVALQDESGARWDFSQLRGQWLVVDFMYTRCNAVCAVMGSKLAQLQADLAGPLAQGRVRLLSISFDPVFDRPPQLQAYLTRFGQKSSAWSAARPTEPQELRALERTFGITVVPDGLGGYTHNDGFGIVDPQGRLVDIAGASASASQVAQLLRAHLQRTVS